MATREKLELPAPTSCCATVVGQQSKLRSLHVRQFTSLRQLRFLPEGWIWQSSTNHCHSASSVRYVFFLYLFVCVLVCITMMCCDALFLSLFVSLLHYVICMRISFTLRQTCQYLFYITMNVSLYLTTNVTLTL